MLESEGRFRLTEAEKEEALKKGGEEELKKQEERMNEATRRLKIKNTEDGVSEILKKYSENNLDQ